MQHDAEKDEEECARKRGKFGEDSQSNEMTGVLEHPCRA